MLVLLNTFLVQIKASYLLTYLLTYLLGHICTASKFKIRRFVI